MSTSAHETFFSNKKEYSNQSLAFYQMFNGKDSDKLISNISSKVELISSRGGFFVCNKNSGAKNSYVSSLKCAFASYPMDELDLIEDTKARFVAKIALKFLGLVLDAIKIDEMLFVGNFLISTNFYPKEFEQSISPSMLSLVQKNPSSYICIRSLNREKNAKLLDYLAQNGWIIIPARVVYLFDFADLSERKKKNHYKNDMKLLAKTKLECVSSGFDADDYQDMQALFEALYIHKHSHHNPQFSASFIQKSYECGFLELYAYRLDGKIIAFISILQMEGVISTPMLGYDTTLPQEMGLYRLLCAKLHSIAEERELDINFSSGAGEFKKLRGGKPAIEYTAIHAKHLSFHKPLILKTIASMIEAQMETFFTKHNLA